VAQYFQGQKVKGRVQNVAYEMSQTRNMPQLHTVETEKSTKFKLGACITGFKCYHLSK